VWPNRWRETAALRTELHLPILLLKYVPGAFFGSAVRLSQNRRNSEILLSASPSLPAFTMFAFVPAVPAAALRSGASSAICGRPVNGRNAPVARVGRSARVTAATLDAMDVGAQKTLDDLMQLPLPKGVHQAEYIWIDGLGKLRSKGRTVRSIELKDLPEWNYDGSSTDQAPGEDSEVILKPGAVFKDPFRPGDNVLVMCGMYTPDGAPIATNTRDSCANVMAKAASEEPWFGLEQEYFLIRPEDGRPMGFPKDGSDPTIPQGPYYCGVGAGKVVGRQIVEAAWRAQLYAGLQISGINAEVCLGQHEFQCGPVSSHCSHDVDPFSFTSGLFRLVSNSDD
jgi:Glutamine synthetase, beta-Grasp domain